MFFCIMIVGINFSNSIQYICVWSCLPDIYSCICVMTDDLSVIQSSFTWVSIGIICLYAGGWRMTNDVVMATDREFYTMQKTMTQVI